MLKIIQNKMSKTSDSKLHLMSLDNVKKAQAFHKSFPQYKQTPLVELNGLSKQLGISDFFVKDESYRFGLNAFKVLGGSYAIANDIAEKTHKDISAITYKYLTSPNLHDDIEPTTYYTATDGNHGRGIAWAAKKMGQKSVILMPKGTQQIRYQKIKNEGADVTIETINYDDCVRKANAMATKADNGVMIQDTAWPNYENIPTWIMQGYGTMALEAANQLKAAGIDRPTHIFIQAGVGSLAGAVVGFFSNLYADNPPTIVVVESQEAACLYETAEANDGKLHVVSGNLNTIMAGLACGEPNAIAFDILQNHVDFFASCPDTITKKGMRVLGAPIKGDQQVVSGESGAVGAGLAATLLSGKSQADYKKQLGLNTDSKVLVFSTEGDTDPENYRRIVWGN